MKVVSSSYGFFIEPKRLVLRAVVVLTGNYQGEPLRIALLSDLHIGGTHVPAARIKTLVSVINGLSPDVIFIAGDFIDGHRSRFNRSADFNTEIRNGLSYLSDIEAERGIYTVLGNHDNFYDGLWLRAHLNAANVHVLTNEGQNFGDLCFIGISDFQTTHSSPVGYSDCKAIAAKIVLTHSPDAFRYLRSDTALAVAGHTHGGQINLPLIGRRVTSTEAGERLAYGLRGVGGVPVYITAGSGTSMLPARFRAPPGMGLEKLQWEP